MFSCCCVNKKALKKELAKNELKAADADKKLNQNDNNENVKTSPQKISATDATSPVSEGRHDKSNSSEEGNNINLSGLIMNDGLVEEINIQLKSRLEREKSTDTTSGGSNITVIEGHVPDESVGIVNADDLCNNLLTNDVNRIVKNNVNHVEEFDIESDRNSANNTNGNDTMSKINATALPSCLFRRDSARASIKKRVRCSETAEVIPVSEYFINADQLHIEDDEDDVFSDDVPAQLPRGNMCTPYVTRKGSLPLVEPLPDWFPDQSESCDTPPTTPLTPLDELALKRHRFFSNLIDAAQSAITSNRIRFDQLSSFDFPQYESPTTNTANSLPGDSKELINLIGRLERIVSRLEHTIPPDHRDTETLTVPTRVSSSYSQTDLTSPDENYLPTVLPHLEKRLERIEQEQRRSREIADDDLKDQPKAMSVNAYEDIVLGSLAQFLALSNKIGDDVAQQSQFVKSAFDAQLKYVTMASQSSAPDQSELPKLLQPTSDQINAIQTFREKNRTSKLFNHLSAISESIPALGWVCVSPTPGPHVKEMNDAGQFYTNRVLKEWKEKDMTHVNWAKAWIQTLNELQQYIKQYHTTGIVWAGKSKAKASSNGPPPPPPMGNLPPPPPMPVFDPTILNANDERNALFAQINQGADITKSLKKVTSEMQTHKNSQLRSGPAPYISGPTPFKPAVAVKPVSAPMDKPPVFNRDGKKWIIEHQKNNKNLLVENAEMNNVVYMFKSDNSTLTVKGKINSIVIDSCKKCCVVFDNLVSSVEFVNCQSVQMQVLGKVPTISIDKTDGCQMYLSKDSLDVEIISSKSSEMNVMLPTPAGDDYVEQAIPEQFKTLVSGNSLQTSCNESLG